MILKQKKGSKKAMLMDGRNQKDLECEEWLFMGLKFVP
ncbi:hypothetical protein C823_002040 [Eubacterium plexicaudatum ASF492]|nr:hypothetical protein C823_002040 [Eubacterium plexicaudatum ASF492]